MYVVVQRTPTTAAGRVMAVSTSILATERVVAVTEGLAGW